MAAFVDCEGPAPRWRQELQAAPAAQYSGRQLLVGDPVRQPDALDAPDRSKVAGCHQPEQGAAGQSGQLGRCVLRTQSSGGQGEQHGPHGAADPGAEHSAQHGARRPQRQAAAAVPGQGAGEGAQRADRADRRHGLRPVERLRRADPHADGRATGQRRAALQPVPHHGALLADPRGAADRPQSSHVQHGLDHRDGDRLSRPDRAAPNSVAPLAEMLRLNGYSTAAFGKSHETAAWEVSPSGPTDRWPTRSGFDKFYGFIGGETNQWAPRSTRT